MEALRFKIKKTTTNKEDFSPTEAVITVATSLRVIPAVKNAAGTITTFEKSVYDVQIDLTETKKNVNPVCADTVIKQTSYKAFTEVEMQGLITGVENMQPAFNMTAVAAMFQAEGYLIVEQL